MSVWQGVRVQKYHQAEDGMLSYWKLEGSWYIKFPDGIVGGLGNHKVIEHEDGTITVDPSIETTQPGKGTWHGHLVRGVWTDV